jgi:predicted phage-related endonuclease
MSPYASPADVWLQICEERNPGFAARRGYTLPPTADNAAIRAGLLFEDNVIALAEAAQGSPIGDREKFVVAPGANYVTAHLDGIYAGGVLHEGKTTSEFAWRASWGEPGTDRIPQDYQIQVQHQMWCEGSESVIVSVLAFPRAQEQIIDALESLTRTQRQDVADVLNTLGYFYQYRVDRSEAVIERLTDVYADFWENNVLLEVEPAISKWSDVARLFPAPKGTIIADEAHVRLAREYRDINAELKKATARKEQIKTEMVRWARHNAAERGLSIDDESLEKLIIVSDDGKKLATYNGSTYR